MGTPLLLALWALWTKVIHSTGSCRVTVKVKTLVTSLGSHWVQHNGGWVIGTKSSHNRRKVRRLPALDSSVSEHTALPPGHIPRCS